MLGGHFISRTDRFAARYAAHRTLAAFRAAALRFAGDILAARAFPPSAPLAVVLILTNFGIRPSIRQLCVGTQAQNVPVRKALDFA